MALRVMLDTMIFDKISAKPGLTERLESLISAGAVEILTTHVQNDQLEGIREPAKREAVSRVPRRVVPTAVFVLDVSRLGQARLGGREVAGIRYDDIKGRGQRDAKDAVIALTAAREADALVTEDKPLRKRVKAATTSTEVWDFAHFLERLADLGEQPRSA